jgi:hypothetical protein
MSQAGSSRDSIPRRRGVRKFDRESGRGQPHSKTWRKSHAASTNANALRSVAKIPPGFGDGMSIGEG